jgi:hypothetical protein
VGNYKTDWTPAFLKLQKKMKETREGEWVPVSKKIQNKYSFIEPIIICKIKADEDYHEYRGETEDKYINLKTFVNFVSLNIAETEYAAESDIEVVGAVNKGVNITLNEIIYYLNWSKPKQYIEFE